jgi:UDP-N-acetylglucosamine 2-epimerase
VAALELVRALEALPETRVLVTEPNADPGAQAVLRVLRSFAERHPERVRLVASLGQVRYASALRAVDVVVGNSSSGLIEAPSAGVPTVNIGDRQKGRLRGASVLDVPESSGAIVDAVRRALVPGFREAVAAAPNPYGTPGVGARIAARLAAEPLAGLARKPFFDR